MLAPTSILLPPIIASNPAAAYLDVFSQRAPGLPPTDLKLFYGQFFANVQNPCALAVLCTDWLRGVLPLIIDLA